MPVGHVHGPVYFLEIDFLFDALAKWLLAEWTRGYCEMDGRLMPTSKDAGASLCWGYCCCWHWGGCWARRLVPTMICVRISPPATEVFEAVSG